MKTVTFETPNLAVIEPVEMTESPQTRMVVEREREREREQLSKKKDREFSPELPALSLSKGTLSQPALSLPVVSFCRTIEVKCTPPLQFISTLAHHQIFKLVFLFLTFSLLLTTYDSFSQGVAINNTGSLANAKAGLDVDFTNLGLLIPRLTTVQRDAITATIPESLLIFNTTTKCFEAYVTGAWNTVSCPAACTPPAAPTSNAASSIACNSFTANWTASTGATSYYLDVATDAGFTSFVAGYNNLDVGNVTSSPVSSLTANTPYYYRVRATTACVSGNSGTQNPTTLIAPAQPSVITGPTPVCQGSSGVAYSVTNVSGVTYTWTYSGTGYTQASGGTTNAITANFSAAATSGTLTVTPSNACGNGTARTLAITTTACCGSALAINHVIGVVAPETKTVNYGTVSSTLGGTGAKCWITQNLGSTNQAISATDATDASAGWYWQFNRKQGYMVGPTPAWTIPSISETSDWLAAQDPCTIELGAGWRIPTYTELFNADATGVWNNCNDAYASVLKLHAAGYLLEGNGSLTSRGFNGRYWSSTQADATTGRSLRLFSGFSEMFSYNKANGFSLRCLKD